MGFTKEIIREGNGQKPQRGQLVTVRLDCFRLRKFCLVSPTTKCNHDFHATGSLHGIRQRSRFVEEVLVHEGSWTRAILVQSRHGTSHQRMGRECHRYEHRRNRKNPLLPRLRLRFRRISCLGNHAKQRVDL